MKVVALISGGKDSCHNMLHCIAEGHDIVALAHLKPAELDEADSFMYQSVGHHQVHLIAEAMGIRFFQRKLKGSSKNVSLDYTVTEEDEVEDLYTLLQEVKRDVHVEAVSTGAILSDYQRLRVENVCSRLGLVSLAYLWRRDQGDLLKEMIDCHIDAIVIKVAALGLTAEKHLGKSISNLYPELMRLSKLYGLNVCGEGGEYESFTLDCPLFISRIVIDEQKAIFHDNLSEDAVSYLNLTKAHLEPKHCEDGLTVYERVSKLPLFSSKRLHHDLGLSSVGNEKHQDTSLAIKSTCCKVSEFAAATCSLANGVCVAANIAVLCTESITLAAFKTFQLLTTIISAHNITTTSIMTVCLYLKQMSDFVAVNEQYKTLFNHDFPCRVCIAICLPDNVQLMLDVTCQTASSADDSCVFKKTMHVESLSHWAPASIGPYNQSISIGDAIYLAGQIGLVPETQLLIDGGVVAQCRLALRHVSRIIAAMDGSVADLISMTCYVVNSNDISAVQSEWDRLVTKSKINNACIVVDYVVVPALPKGAFVEWHAHAIRNLRNHRSFAYDTPHVEGGKISAFISTSMHEQLGCMVTGNASFRQPSNVSADIAVSQLLYSIEAVRKKAREIEISSPGQYCRMTRLFYCSTAFTFDDVEQACVKLCTDQAILPRCVSIVPVLGLATDDTLMHISF